MRLLAKASASVDCKSGYTHETDSKIVGHDINDLRFIAEIAKSSGRRIVIEDFHYLCIEQRKYFAFDLKAMWDYGLFISIIGIWSQSNMLIFLNPDLTGRVHEVSLSWSEEDLKLVLEKGGSALHIKFSEQVVLHFVSLAVGNVGILQKLTLMALDEADIQEGYLSEQVFSDKNKLDDAALAYAEQLNPLYQQFAKNVAHGIRTRSNSTGIYAYAISIIIGSTDNELQDGLHLDTIYSKAHARQPRIQRNNLALVLEKIEELQIDPDGRGLVIAYNPHSEVVSIVDRQLLLYRKYCTVKWPWEGLIAEVGEKID